MPVKLDSKYRFRMTDFREAAKTATSWSSFANQWGMDIRKAKETCKLHEIQPGFVGKRKERSARL